MKRNFNKWISVDKILNFIIKFKLHATINVLSAFIHCYKKYRGNVCCIFLRFSIFWQLCRHLCKVFIGQNIDSLLIYMLFFHIFYCVHFEILILGFSSDRVKIWNLEKREKNLHLKIMEMHIIFPCSRKLNILLFSSYLLRVIALIIV